MTRRKTDTEFRAELKALVGNEYATLDLYQGAMTKIRFYHITCGSIFAMPPSSFLQGHRCPICAQKIAHAKHRKSDRAFKAQIERLVGQEYAVIGKYQGAKEKVKFKHKKCGYIFKMLPSNFLQGHRCPKCMIRKQASNLRKTDRKFKAEVKNLVGEKYLILGKYIDSQTKIKFRHKKCGLTFMMRPRAFIDGQRCPFCQSSKGEQSITKYLKTKNILFETQFTISGCKDKYVLPFDFAVFNKNHTLNCLIEYQGEQHFYDPFSYHNQWFSKASVLNTQKHDAMKLQYCKDHGIKLIRINHPQTSNKSNSIEFVKQLVNKTLNKELHVV